MPVVQDANAPGVARPKKQVPFTGSETPETKNADGLFQNRYGETALELDERLKRQDEARAAKTRAVSDQPREFRQSAPPTVAILKKTVRRNVGNALIPHWVEVEE